MHTMETREHNYNIINNSHKKDIFLDIFNVIGEYGNLILFIFTIFLLKEKENLLFYYVIGAFLNYILNTILKGIIQQPRPNDDIKKFEMAIGHGKSIFFKNGIPADIFGMPSGHSQDCAFSLIYMYLVTGGKQNIFYLYAFITCLTVLERIYFNYHTPLQCVIGLLVGGGFANFVFYIVTDKMKKILRMRPDDNMKIL